MIRKTLLSSIVALAASAAIAFPQIAMAANTFYGTVVHVSTNNIKVEDPKTKQTLSFEIAPSFKQVFSSDGKTTKQMADIKAGQYVGIIYDQKLMGVRHADKIYLLNNANQKISSMKG
jgi:hypothetical protein